MMAVSNNLESDALLMVELCCVDSFDTSGQLGGSGKWFVVLGCLSELFIEFGEISPLIKEWGLGLIDFLEVSDDGLYLLKRHMFNIHVLIYRDINEKSFTVFFGEVIIEFGGVESILSTVLHNVHEFFAFE